MTIYLISARDKGAQVAFGYMPELSASRYAAELRKLQLEKEGLIAEISTYEVKTQGCNFNSIAQTGGTFNIGQK